MLCYPHVMSEQIRFLLQNLVDCGSDPVVKELLQFVDYGIEGRVLLLQTCLDHINNDRGAVHKMKLRPDTLSTIIRYLLHQPNFGTVFCESLRSMVINEKLLGDFSNAVCLTIVEKIALGLALAEAENLETRKSGQNFSMAQVEELFSNPASTDSLEQIQNVVMFLYNSEGLAKHVDSFMKILALMDLKDGASAILAPFLSDNLLEASLPGNMDLFNGSSENEFDTILAEMESETSLADVIEELGYGCTMSTSLCKEVLSLLAPLNEVTLSRLLITMARTGTGLDDNHSSYATFCSAIGSNALSDLSCLSSLNIDVVVDSIHQLAPEINWIVVMENLDHEDFNIPNEGAFSIFMSIYARACQDPFPLHTVCSSIWRNSDGQLSFLKHAISASPEIFTFAHSVNKLVYDEVLPGYELPHGLANHAWLSIDLIEVLCQLAERGHASSVWALFDYPLKHFPEILLLGIAQVNTAYNLLQSDVSSSVFPLIVANGTSSMLSHLWRLNPKLVVRGCIDMIVTDRCKMLRIVDICQEIKILPLFLEQIPFSAGIQLAILASQKEYINLETWLSCSLSSYKDTFFEECLKILKELSSDAADNKSTSLFQHSGTVVNLRTEITSTFLKVLHANTQQISSDYLAQELKRLQGVFVNVSPQLQNEGTSDVAASDEFSIDIEAKSNSYYNQLFYGKVPVDVMVQMLGRYKDSSDRRERSIFECMIDSLFEEYKFFPKYPEKQLKIAAILFGSLIRHRLLTQFTLDRALHCVLDALRKPPDSKIFTFATTALEQFLDYLIEFPQFCNHILQISYLRVVHPELFVYAEHVLARSSSGRLELHTVSSDTADPHSGSTPATLENLEVPDSTGKLSGSRNSRPAQQFPSPLQTHGRQPACLGDKHKEATGGPSNFYSTVVASSQNSLHTSSMQYVTSVSALASSSVGVLHSTRGSASTSMVRHSYSTGFGTALNIQTLVAAAEKRDTAIEAPTADVQDKILFMINNSSTSNIDAKVKEFADIMRGQYYPWFAQYMVMKRASIEPNFHDLYLKFLDKIDSKALNKEIVKATYENCRVLLRSELIKSSSEERSLLKNLGSWLGKLTIGRNRVLLFRELDPKSLIKEAYVKGLMIAVIPFTSKILEPCRRSPTYRPPNPWTMGILGLLAEIYALPNLKMNLKFDIEVLFKNLGVDLKDVKPSSLLKDCVREVEGNPDFSVKDLGPSQPQVVTEIRSGVLPTFNHVDIQSELVNASCSGGHITALSQYASGFHLGSGPSVGDEKMAAPSLSGHIASGQAAPSQSPYFLGQVPSPAPNVGCEFILSQELNILGLDYFKRVVPAVMEKAMKDVSSPVVQCSLAVAIQTTKELVLKDFPLENDETGIYSAARMMVGFLAGYLAHVRSKDLLRGSISSHLWNSLQGINTATELLEQAVAIVINDNLDLGCRMIEEAATKKALQTIDEEIARQLALRRKQREDVGPSFCNAGVYTQGAMGVIPEALHPGQEYLSLCRQHVYEDFVRFRWQNYSIQNANADPSGDPTNSGLSGGYVSSKEQLNPSFYPARLVTTGPSPVALIQEEMDPSSAQHFSSSSVRIEAIDGAITQGPKISSVAAFSSAAGAPNVHLLDVTSAIKDVVATFPSSSSTSALEHLGSARWEPSLSMADVLEKYQTASQKLKTLVSKGSGDVEIQGVIAQIPEMILKCINRDEVALAVAQKVFKSLYENTSNAIHVDAHLSILAAIRDVCKLVVKELTSWVIYSDEDRKFNAHITVGLICKGLLNLAEYNMNVAKLIDGGRNKAATEFATDLLTLLVQESRASVSELPNLVDALAKVASKPGSPEFLQQLIEILKNPAVNPAVLSAVADKEAIIKQPKEKKVAGDKNFDNTIASKEDNTVDESAAIDLAGNHDQISRTFAEWFQIYERHGTNNGTCATFIKKLQQNGYLNGDEISDRFFRILTELCVAHCISNEVTSSAWSTQLPPSAQNLSFLAVDAYAKLVSLILRNRVTEPGPNKRLVWQKIFPVIVNVLQRDAKQNKESFNARPYYRLFINWLLDLAIEDPFVDGAMFQVLTTFADTFHALQPLEVPAFCFAWLELVSHRNFMPKLLTVNAPSGWIYVQQLLIDLFKFMEPHLRSAELQKPIQALYRGTLRVLLVLLHDFPEFLAVFHFSFCNVIPSSCIQMRNIILSAFPRNMRMPDPSTPNLKIDLLPEMHVAPRILPKIDAALKNRQLKSDVDDYLNTRNRASPLFSELRQRLLFPQTEAAKAGSRYDIPLMNSLVLYIGIQTIQQLQTRTSQGQQITHNGAMELSLMNPALDIYQILLMELDTEGRYLFLNAMANQLRYPNCHTHLFSFVILYLFNEANQEIIQEQITRVLLERLIAQKPHPWGLLATFIELIKNPRYNFWSRGFTRCAPEIERLFESVSRSCGGARPVEEGIASTSNVH